MHFTTPILFLIFNRPDTTQLVFDKIKEIKPAELYISADGPRENKNEELKCSKAREIVNQIDWDCNLTKNFSDINLGCKKAVSDGISWFFQNVQEGIILEDDCLPDNSFFHFCAELLSRYRNDERIMHLGGTNFQDGIKRGTESYYYSRLVHVWGWATWRRAWNKYDVTISSFKNFTEQHLIKEIFPKRKQQEFWIKTFDQVYSGKKDTWDFQWVYTVMINNALSIIPNQNLVTNLGFDSNATHTVLKGSPLSKRKADKLEVITHPEFIIPFGSADEYTFKKYLAPGKLSKLRQVLNSKMMS